MCDSAFWLLRKLNVILKFCKGCKNFVNLNEFSDKPDASKCTKCRERGRTNYISRKNSNTMTNEDPPSKKRVISDTTLTDSEGDTALTPNELHNAEFITTVQPPPETPPPTITVSDSSFDNDPNQLVRDGRTSSGSSSQDSLDPVPLSRFLSEKETAMPHPMEICTEKADIPAVSSLTIDLKSNSSPSVATLSVPADPEAFHSGINFVSPIVTGTQSDGRYLLPTISLSKKPAECIEDEGSISSNQSSSKLSKDFTVPTILKRKFKFSKSNVS